VADAVDRRRKVKFEYRVNQWDHVDELERDLAVMAAQGWRLHSIARMPATTEEYEFVVVYEKQVGR
jgi:hypothetical protein